MKTKKCTKCQIEKKLIDFGSLKHGKDGYMSICKECNNKRYQNYRKNNPEKVKKILHEWFENNLGKKKEYRSNYKLRKHEQRKERKLIDPVFKLISTMRSRSYKYMKQNNITKRNKTFEIIGCTPLELKNYLENQFNENMTWENHGQYGWHVDHIIPLVSAKNEDELYKLFHYTNLQPLWWDKNIEKSSKIFEQ